MELAWPLDIAPAAQGWKVIDNAGMFGSPFVGASRVYGRPGVRMGCSMFFTNQNRVDRHRLLGFLAAVNGRYSSVWIPDFGTNLRGSFPASELLSNVNFTPSGGTTGWTSTNAELVLSADSGRMRMSRTAVAANRHAYAQATVPSGVAMLFRAGMLAGRGALTYALRIGSTTTGNEMAGSSTFTAAGYQQISGITTATTAYANVQDNVAGRAADNFTVLEQPSLSRCALVNGASQVGSALWIDQLPASTLGLLLAGDVVAVYTTRWEVKRLVMNLNSNGSGQGQLVFEPALSSAPADNAPVAIYQPRAKFMLTTDTTQIDNKPGQFSDIQLDFVEDFR